MTTIEASKLQRGAGVVLTEPFADRSVPYIVELVQIRLSDMAVLLTTDKGEVVECKAEDLMTDTDFENTLPDDPRLERNDPRTPRHLRSY